MHKIFWDTMQVGMLTDQIDATKHKHWMLQLFYCPDQQLNLKVNGEAVSGNCILVGNDVIHEFATGDVLHMSLLIEVTSDVAIGLLENYLKENAYVDLSKWIGDSVAKAFYVLGEKMDITAYQSFCKVLYDNLGITESGRSVYDERVLEVFRMMERKESCIESIRIENEVSAVNKNGAEHGVSTANSIAAADYEQIVTVKELADLVALSPSRLAHIFKEQTGIPLKSYLVLQKMYRAFYLLLHGTNITDAAMAAGFDSPSHFAATTKSLMGTSARMAVKDSDFLKVFTLPI